MGLFNLIWFVFFGWWQALTYLLLSLFFAITIVGIPIEKSLLQFAKLSAFPFGKEIIKETELKGTDNVSEIRKIFGIIVNIIWLPVGAMMAIMYVISGIVSFYNNYRYSGRSCLYPFCKICSFVNWSKMRIQKASLCSCCCE